MHQLGGSNVLRDPRDRMDPNQISDNVSNIESGAKFTFSQILFVLDIDVKQRV